MAYTTISIPLILALMTEAPPSSVASPVGLDMYTFQKIDAGHATEQKCRQLADGDREELSTHAAFAETAAVKLNGADRVMAARESARSTADCTAGAREKALSGLEAGRRFEKLYVNETEAAVRARSRAEKQRPKPKPRQAAALNRTREGQAAAANAGGGGRVLDRFKQQTHAYYLQRRCNHLVYGKALHFWKMIAAQHKRLIGRYGANAVVRAEKIAQSAAARQRCGSRTQQTVMAGLQSISRDVRAY